MVIQLDDSRKPYSKDKSSIIQVFTRNEDLFLNIFVLICLLASFFQFLDVINLSAKETLTLHFLAKIVFLNHIHIYFTPLMLLTTQSGRNWVNTRFQSPNFIIRTTLFIFVFFAIHLVIKEYLRGGWMKWLIYFSLAWGAAHVILQSFGLSKMYRSRDLISDTYFKCYSVRFFKYLAPLLILILFLSYISFLKGNFKYLSAISFFLVASYIIEPVIYSRKWGRTQWADCRLLLYPMACFSTISLYASLAMHGIEYLFLTRKYFNGEVKNGKVASSSIIILSLLIILLLSSIKLFHLELTRSLFVPFINNQFVLSILLSFAGTFTLCHYWVDGLIYSKKHDSNINWILKNISN